MANVQFITDDHGNRTAVIVPLEDWEKTEKAKDVLEHIYFAGLIDERKGGKATTGLDSLLDEEGRSRAELES